MYILYFMVRTKHIYAHSSFLKGIPYTNFIQYQKPNGSENKFFTKNLSTKQNIDQKAETLVQKRVQNSNPVPP